MFNPYPTSNFWSWKCYLLSKSAAISHGKCTQHGSKPIKPWLDCFPWKQSDLDPYCLQYWLPKNISRQELQKTKVVTGKNLSTQIKPDQQPRHQPSLIGVFTVHMKKVWVYWAHSEECRLCECPGWSVILWLSCHGLYMSHGMWFPTMWHFDKCRLRQACAASFEA